MRVDIEDHVGHTVANFHIWMCCAVVEELFDGFHCLSVAFDCLLAMDLSAMRMVILTIRA